MTAITVSMAGMPITCSLVPQMVMQEVITSIWLSLAPTTTVFTGPSDGNSGGNYINMVEFSSYHNSGDDGIGLTRVSTTIEYYSSLNSVIVRV
jgi:hypothetical protein